MREFFYWTRAESNSYTHISILFLKGGTSWEAAQVMNNGYPQVQLWLLCGTFTFHTIKPYYFIIDDYAAG